jgi:molybdate transport system ATP-binding protein
MDEPLTSLDRERRSEMLLTIERLRDQVAIPILYVSHDQDEIARLAGAVERIGQVPAARTRDPFVTSIA